MHSAPSGRGAFGGGIATLRDAVAATMTAAVAGPISHVPSVIASYQQAHAVGLRTACGEIWRAGGISRFWGGLRPVAGVMRPCGVGRVPGSGAEGGRGGGWGGV